MRIEQTILSSAKVGAKSCSARRAKQYESNGAAARADIAAAIEQPVHLFLHVKVREGWGDDPDATGKWDWSFRKE